MPTPIDPNTVYDNSHTWQNADERVQAEKVFLRSPEEEQRMQQAMATADPSMPEAVIQENMTNGYVPPLYGYDPTQPTIDMMFGGMPDPHMNDAHPTDFSGTNAGIQSSSTPSMPTW
jgi:hypothetical protein